MGESPTLSRWEKFRALFEVVEYDPRLAGGIVVLGVASAALEGFGVTFLFPLVEQVTGSAQVGGANEGRLSELFAAAYEAVGVPLTLETVLVGATVVVGLRYGSSILFGWARAHLQARYTRDLRRELFESMLQTRVAVVEQYDHDELMNTVTTEASHASNVIMAVVTLLETMLMGAVYLCIAFYLAPLLTTFALVSLGGLALAIWVVLEPAYTTGDSVADANETIQQSVLSGVRGALELKLFDSQDRVLDTFRRAVDRQMVGTIRLRRNETVLNKLHQFGNAVVVFVLIYLLFTVSSLSLGAVAVFLFAMFRLGPRMSSITDILYYAEGQLPHLVKTQRLAEGLAARTATPTHPTRVPDSITEVELDRVTFGYEPGSTTIRDASGAVHEGELVALVGPSGVGKSTLLRLVAGLYEPDEGEVRADGVPLSEFDPEAWFERVSVVSQQPFVFNDTLRENVRIGNQHATTAALHEACERAQLADVVDALPDGYDTVIGDDGARLSGGQRQRVALARALLKDADLLILDEATSELDRTTEAEIYETIETMDGPAITLVATHRVAVLEEMDRLFAVENGTITELNGRDEMRRAIEGMGGAVDGDPTG